MARYNNASCDHTKWTNAKLISEAKKYANLESFSVGYNEVAGCYKTGWHDQVNKDQMPIEDFVREQTRLYRVTWLQPLLDEIERRFLKGSINDD